MTIAALSGNMLDMNTSQTTNSPFGTVAARNAVITEHYKAIRGAVTNVLRRAGMASEDNVDDHTSAAVIHIMEYSLTRYDASHGLNLRKYLMICAERHTGKAIRRVDNRADNCETLTTTGQDYDTGNNGRGDGRDSRTFETTDIPAGSADVLSTHDAHSVTFALLIERMACRNLPAAVDGLTDAERTLLAAIKESESWGEVAERMGVSQPTISRAWPALADKLRRLLKVG